MTPVSTQTSLLDELAWRGLLYQCSDEELLRDHLKTGQRAFYIGFDPSADSLTIGNLLAMTLVIRGARAGLRPFVLLGGGTGLIGDPSGKSEERTLISVEEAQRNVNHHQQLMTSIFKRALRPEQMPTFVNNYDWLSKLSAIEFMRDVGKFFPVAEMMRRDSVSRRLNDPNVGLSYTEFSYSLLQSYDFMKLCQDRQVTIQLGASDQWGNMVAGIDYVRKTIKESVHIITCPLLLRADGSKFGKSEKGAIWLSAERTSPYEMYQFFINLADDEAEKFALFFSLESKEFIEKLIAEHKEAAHKRDLQRHIAREITTLVHGAEACQKVEKASQALFSGDVKSIDVDMLEQVFSDAPSTELPMDSLKQGLNLVELLVTVGLAESKKKAREHVTNKAVWVNGDQVSEESVLNESNLLNNSLILIRRGKREWRVVRFN